MCAIAGDFVRVSSALDQGKPNAPTQAMGFGLLELLLAMGLASVLILAMVQLQQSLLRQAAWLQAVQGLLLLNQTTRNQIQQKLSSQCLVGVTQGDARSWRMWLNKNGRCQQFELTYSAAKQTLSVRRVGSRASPWLSDIDSLQVQYGVTNDESCAVHAWLPAVTSAQSDNVRQLRLHLALFVSAGVLSSEPQGGFLWQPRTGHLSNQLELLVELQCEA